MENYGNCVIYPIILSRVNNHLMPTRLVSIEIESFTVFKTFRQHSRLSEFMNNFKFQIF